MKKVMVFGTFDFLHIGHLHFLAQAKKLGDQLIVVVTRDSVVQRLKRTAPIHNQGERKKIAEHIDIVNTVIMGDSRVGTYGVIKKVHPDIIALGYDQKGLAKDLQRYLSKKKVTARVVMLKPYKYNGRKSSKIKKALKI